MQSRWLDRERNVQSDHKLCIESFHWRDGILPYCAHFRLAVASLFENDLLLYIGERLISYKKAYFKGSYEWSVEMQGYIVGAAFLGE